MSQLLWGFIGPRGCYRTFLFCLFFGRAQPALKQDAQPRLPSSPLVINLLLDEDEAEGEAVVGAEGRGLGKWDCRLSPIPLQASV